MLAAGQRERAHRLGLVHLAVAHERPDLAARGVLDAAPRQVLHEVRLVDRQQWPEAHRDRRELPELRHQPGVRVAREATAVHLGAEAQQLLLGEAALEERARVDARGRVTLDVDEVTAVLLRRRVPEVVEALLVERRRGLVARDVAAELGAVGVRAQHEHDRVPAHVGTDALLERGRVVGGRVVRAVQRVDVGRHEPRDDGRALVAGVVEERLEQRLGALGAVGAQHAVEGLEPLGGLGRVDVRCDAHVLSSSK